MKTCDVVIVGGGIIGGSIAYELARRNLNVVVLDRQQPGQEASWAAAGMLSPAPDTPAAIPLVPLARASLALYPQFISAVQETSGFETGFRAEGALEALFHADAERELSTLVALHHGLGLACEPLPLDEAREMEPALGREMSAAAFLPDEASVDNRALTNAVLAAAQAAGVTLRPDVEVTSLLRDGAACAGVKTSAEEAISAPQVVLAAGCWSALLPEAAQYAPTLPVRGQMIALQHSGKTIRRVLRSTHVYLVPRDDGRPQKIVAGSTLESAGYEKRVTSGGIAKILSAVNELAPELADAEVVETWCGLRPGTPDQLPILGPTEMEGLMIATGHYRNGILLAPVTAKLIAEWIVERRTSLDWARFNPLRFGRNASGRVATAP